MNKDYTIIIHTDTPINFDNMERRLLGSWDMTMTTETTGDSWTKAAEAPETSTTAPASFEVVEPLPEMGEWSQG